MTTTNIANHLMGIAAAIAMCVSLWGCESLSKPTGARFASVEIGQHSRQEIEDATIKVFERANYESFRGEDELVFESEGKEWMQLAYGSNIASAVPVLERVEVQVVGMADGTFRLQCKAYVVPPMVSYSKEVKLRQPRNNPYVELLDEIVRELSKTR